MGVGHKSVVRALYAIGEIPTTGCSSYNLNSQAEKDKEGARRVESSRKARYHGGQKQGVCIIEYM